MVQLQDIEYRVTNVKAYSRTEFSVLIVLDEMLVKVVKEKEVRSCVLFVTFLLHIIECDAG